MASKPLFGAPQGHGGAGEAARVDSVDNAGGAELVSEAEMELTAAQHCAPEARRAFIAASLSESPYYSQWHNTFVAPRTRASELVDAVTAFQNRHTGKGRKG